MAKSLTDCGLEIEMHLQADRSATTCRAGTSPQVHAKLMPSATLESAQETSIAGETLGPEVAKCGNYTIT